MTCMDIITENTEMNKQLSNYIQTSNPVRSIQTANISKDKKNGRGQPLQAFKFLAYQAFHYHL